jgi:hypothetical protein
MLFLVGARQMARPLLGGNPLTLRLQPTLRGLSTRAVWVQGSGAMRRLQGSSAANALPALKMQRGLQRDLIKRS